MVESFYDRGWWNEYRGGWVNINDDESEGDTGGAVSNGDFFTDPWLEPNPYNDREHLNPKYH